MTDLHRALYGFWSSFGMSAYLSGHVPKEAAYPYVTFEVSEGAAFGKTYLTAFAWYKAASGANINAQRAAFLDAVKARIGPGGLKLDNVGAFCVIYPNETNFLGYYDDPEDANVVGARVSYQIDYYK